MTIIMMKETKESKARAASQGLTIESHRNQLRGKKIKELIEREAPCNPVTIIMMMTKRM